MCSDWAGMLVFRNHRIRTSLLVCSELSSVGDWACLSHCVCTSLTLPDYLFPDEAGKEGEEEASFHGDGWWKRSRQVLLGCTLLFFPFFSPFRGLSFLKRPFAEQQNLASKCNALYFQNTNSVFYSLHFMCPTLFTFRYSLVVLAVLKTSHIWEAMDFWNTCFGSVLPFVCKEEKTT